MIRSAVLVTVLALTLGSSEGVSAMELEKATFAGGCFWCVEATLEKVPGVKSVVSGYTGGHVENPSYQQVTTGRTGHIEAVEVTFDPTQISYEQVLQAFWMEFDPTDAGGSFYDRGQQYTSAIWYHSDEQRRIAEASKQRVIDSGVFREPIVTPILPAETFYPAEEYHQDYYKKNAGHYNRYRTGSGRDRFIREKWGDREARMARIEAAATDGPVGDEPADKVGNGRTYVRPSDAELRKRLTPLQYRVTQRDGTEPAFRNEYWDNKQEGIYVDVASGEPLFSSVEKYESGTGWPSFWAPLVADNIVTKRDYKLILPRTEVRSKHGDSHLGHVFKDGPEPTGLRYCLNSAALRFIPKEDLEQEGYGEFLAHFE